MSLSRIPFSFLSLLTDITIQVVRVRPGRLDPFGFWATERGLTNICLCCEACFPQEDMGRVVRSGLICPFVNVAPFCGLTRIRHDIERTFRSALLFSLSFTCKLVVISNRF